MAHGLDSALGLDALPVDRLPTTTSRMTQYLGLGKSGKTRTRLPHSKSRKGCLTCKQRHMRCDETRPVCEACRKGGRECAGYRDDPKPKPAAASQAARPSDALTFRNTFGPNCRQQRSRVVGDDPTLRIVPYNPHHESESLAWDYFHLETAPLLGLYSCSQFWSEVVPRLAQACPAVKQAVLAIACLHQKVQPAPVEAAPSSPSAANDSDLSLEHYGRALHELQVCVAQVQDASTQTTALLASLLLAVYESLRGRRGKVALHVKYGLHMAHEGTPMSRVWSDRSWVELYLGKMSMSMSLFDSTTINDHDAQLTIESGAYALLDVMCNSHHMAPVDLLQASIHNLINDVYRFVLRVKCGQHNDDEARQRELGELKQQHAKWTAAAQASKSMPWSSIAAKAAHAKSLFAYAILETCQSMREDAFDQFNDVFAEILLLMAGAIKGHVDCPPDQRRQPEPFSVDFQAIPLLFHVALHCRHPQLRRGAIELLEYCPQREGIWTTQIAMAATSAIVDFEESFSQGIDANGMPIILEEHRVFHLYRCSRDPASTDVKYTELELIRRPRPDQDAIETIPIRVQMDVLYPKPFAGDAETARLGSNWSR